MKECTKCILDDSTMELSLNSNGICNYCLAYERHALLIKRQFEGVTLEDYFLNIKGNYSPNGYDCIIGVSGGVDSSYLMYLAKAHGLTPLILHVDTGWNDAIAVKNIHNAINLLNFDLIVHTVDWNALKTVQKAFIAQGILDLDIPQDHLFPAILSMYARKYRIKAILSGHNFQSEFILPSEWSLDSKDAQFIRSVLLESKIKLPKNYPLQSFMDAIIDRKIYRIKSYRPLYLIDYNADKIKELLKRELNWADYGGKHYESKFTKIFQGYLLLKKYNIDKRKAHLSNMVMSNQISRADALEKIRKPAIDPNVLNNELRLFKDKLDLTDDDIQEYLKIFPDMSKYKTQKDQLGFKLVKKITGFFK